MHSAPPAALTEGLPDPALAWPIPWAAVELIARAEGCRLEAYRCPAGVWTCGWGETEGVGPTTSWPQAFADRRFRDSLDVRTEAVRAACTREPGAAQLGAMVSLAYNIGVEGFRRSTVLAAHNRGDTQAAARAFSLWDKARVNGDLQALPGLAARRLREAALYLSAETAAAPMPQEVSGDSRLSASPIARSGAVVAGVGGAAVLGDLGAQFEALKGLAAGAQSLVVGTLGLSPDWVGPLLLVAAGCVAIWQRIKQRREGWA